MVNSKDVSGQVIHTFKNQHTQIRCFNNTEALINQKKSLANMPHTA